MDSNTIFLFGAGASKQAGIPIGDEITNMLLNYSSYCPSESGIAIENLFRYLQAKIANYLEVKSTEINYELIIGALADLSNREDNITVPFFGEMDPFIRETENTIKLKDILEKFYMLYREILFVKYPPEYLYPLKEFLTKNKPLDIFTLNHDNSLEMALGGLGVSFTTGFRRTDLIWDCSEFDNKLLDVRIFKLHGSINGGLSSWYPPPPEKSDSSKDLYQLTEYYLAYYPELVDFVENPIGIVQSKYKKSGMIGIMNFGMHKESMYTTGQFNSIFNHFIKGINSASFCVVAGYSFQDEKINEILYEALMTRIGVLHMIIVDPNAHAIVFGKPILEQLWLRGGVTPIAGTLGQILASKSLLTAINSVLRGEVNSSDFTSVSNRFSGSVEKEVIDLKRAINKLVRV